MFLNKLRRIFKNVYYEGIKYNGIILNVISCVPKYVNISCSNNDKINISNKQIFNLLKYDNKDYFIDTDDNPYFLIKFKDIIKLFISNIKYDKYYHSSGVITNYNTYNPEPKDLLRRISVFLNIIDIKYSITIIEYLHKITNTKVDVIDLRDEISNMGTTHYIASHKYFETNKKCLKIYSDIENLYKEASIEFTSIVFNKVIKYAEKVLKTNINIYGSINPEYNIYKCENIMLSIKYNPEYIDLGYNDLCLGVGTPLNLLEVWGNKKTSKGHRNIKKVMLKTIVDIDKITIQVMNKYINKYLVENNI